jgi:hypothetical protein
MGKFSGEKDHGKLTQPVICKNSFTLSLQVKIAQTTNKESAFLQASLENWNAGLRYQHGEVFLGTGAGVVKANNKIKFANTCKNG